MKKIMVVDDDVNVLNSLKRTLARKTEWEVSIYDNPREAADVSTIERFDLFISDYRMPGMNGVELLRQTKASQPNAMRLILSGATDHESLVRAINEAEIFRILTKPVDSSELIMTISQALQLREALEENRRLAETLRIQQAELKRKQSALNELAEKHPLIAQINWADDGSIIIDEGANT